MPSKQEKRLLRGEFTEVDKILVHNIHIPFSASLFQVIVTASLHPVIKGTVSLMLRSDLRLCVPLIPRGVALKQSGPGLLLGELLPNFPSAVFYRFQQTLRAAKGYHFVICAVYKKNGAIQGLLYPLGIVEHVRPREEDGETARGHDTQTRSKGGLQDQSSNLVVVLLSEIACGAATNRPAHNDCTAGQITEPLHLSIYR